VYTYTQQELLIDVHIPLKILLSDENNIDSALWNINGNAV
jgi:hypothetical protein